VDGDVTAWTRTASEHGVVLRAGDSWIRIRPRVHELIGVRALVDATLATLEAPSSIVHEPPRELITDEGELAAVGGARCISHRRELECTVAIVGAGPALCIEALGEPALARDHALALTRELGLGLGGARRRWFRYDPPAGWFGVRRYGATVWLHPDHPRVPAIAYVFDARPFLAGDAERFDQRVLLAMGENFVARGESTACELRSAHGLEGWQRILEGARGGRELVRIAVACADDRFAYMAHFEGANDPALIETVRRMFDSFRPLPHVGRNDETFAMWDA